MLGLKLGTELTAVEEKRERVAFISKQNKTAQRLWLHHPASSKVHLDAVHVIKSIT